MALQKIIDCSISWLVPVWQGLLPVGYKCQRAGARYTASRGPVVQAYFQSIALSNGGTALRLFNNTLGIQFGTIPIAASQMPIIGIIKHRFKIRVVDSWDRDDVGVYDPLIIGVQPDGAPVKSSKESCWCQKSTTMHCPTVPLHKQWSTQPENYSLP